MRRHLYTFILSAGLLASGAAAEISAQTNEKNQIASVKTDFDAEKEKTEAAEKSAEKSVETPAEKPNAQPAENKKFAPFVPRPFSGLSRIGVTPGQV
ncbi:MAG TPA: hypothetical protein VEQ34_03460, partial [Pyrinomonadaceae bacterium]|nr:hypothetical protein [Pyrinomonadaceae bacterium]